MQLLSKDECRSWASQHGFRVNESFRHPIANEVAERLDFLIPSDTGARVALARALWENTGAGAETLLWITDWGVWPSGEHPPLADAARRGLGVDRPLIEAPGHLVTPAESDAGMSILVLSILFLWDCWVLPIGNRPSAFISHDEFGLVDVRHGDRGLAKLLVELDVMQSPSQA